MAKAQGELQMSRTNRESKPLLIALALMAALAMGAGLVRGPTDEEVLGEAVRDVASGAGTVLYPAAPKLSPLTDASEATELDEKAPIKSATCASRYHPQSRLQWRETRSSRSGIEGSGFHSPLPM
jgi:hypothetical protein